jgi:O-antigen/teichoic acid export membrane protein
VLATSALMIPLGLGVQVILARLFGPGGKGAYDLAMASATTLAFVLGLALPSGIIYVVSRGEADLDRVDRMILLAGVVQFAVAGLILGGAMLADLGRNFFPFAGWTTAVAAVFVVCYSVTTCWRAVLIGVDRIAESNAIELANRVGLICALLLLAIWSSHVAIPAGPDSAFLLTVLILLLTAALYRARTRLHLPVHAAAAAAGTDSGKAALHAILRISWPSYLANVAQFLTYRVDIFIVGYLLGLESLALYVLALGLAQLLWIIPDAIGTVLFPFVSARRHPDPASASFAAQASRTTVLLSLAAAVPLALLGHALIFTVFGSAFAGAATLLHLLLPGTIAFATAKVVSNYLIGIGRPQSSIGIAVCGLLLSVALNVLLIPWLGLAGAAIATSVAYIASTIVSALLFVSHSRLPLLSLFLVRRCDLSWAGSLVGGFLRQLGTGRV